MFSRSVHHVAAVAVLALIGVARADTGPEDVKALAARIDNHIAAGWRAH